jgi:beta-alanine degradation protein BauB
MTITPAGSIVRIVPLSIYRGCTFVRATSTVQVHNDRVIVTEWRFAPGADTGHHVHAHDYIVVPLTTGTLRLVEADGVRDAALQAGISYARPAGVSHNVINANAHEFRFVEIELK